MTASVPFPLPPGRALAAWRRELAPYRPRRLWLAHLLLHRVEFLVRVAQRRSLDSLRAALLRQLAAGAPPEGLAVDRELLGRWTRELAAEGLVEAADGRRLTERGRLALESNAYAAPVEERRVFTFVEAETPGGAPQFAALERGAVPLAPPAGWRFDATALDACVRRPEEWKRRRGFPTDVEAVLPPPHPDARTAADWRRVILDRPEEILLVFVVDEEAGAARRLGFAVRAADWVLQTEAPALTPDRGPDDILPDVGAEPAPEVWREAWREWRRRRDLSAAEADAGRVEPAEDRVRATVSREAAARLGGERTDAWLVAGTGRTRVAAPLEIVEEN